MEGQVKEESHYRDRRAKSLLRIDGLCNRGSKVVRIVGHGVSDRTIFPDPGRAGNEGTLCGAALEPREQREQNAGKGGRLSSGGVLPVTAAAAPASPSFGVPCGVPSASASAAAAVSSAPWTAASTSSGRGGCRRMGTSRGCRRRCRRRSFPCSTASSVSLHIIVNTDFAFYGTVNKP